MSGYPAHTTLLQLAYEVLCSHHGPLLLNGNSRSSHTVERLDPPLFREVTLLSRYLEDDTVARVVLWPPRFGTCRRAEASFLARPSNLSKAFTFHVLLNISRLSHNHDKMMSTPRCSRSNNILFADQYSRVFSLGQGIE